METARQACALISTPGKGIENLPRPAQPLSADAEFAAEVIAHLFRRFEKLFDKKWSSKWPDTESRERAADDWAIELAEFSANAIGHAINLVLKEGKEWPPECQRFYQLCALYKAPIYHRVQMVPLLTAQSAKDTPTALINKQICRGMHSDASDEDKKAFEDYQKQQDQ